MVEDLKFACRRLRHSPRFTAAILLTLALTVGVNAAIFSVADAVLFRPLPYDEPDRLFVLRMANMRTGGRYTLVQYGHTRLIAEHHRGIVGLGMLEAGPRLTATTADGARLVPAVAVSANYFDLLGVRAARGRLFTSGEPSTTGRPALLAYATWRQSFGGDEQIVGRSIAFGTMTVDVIGVLPERFVFPSAFAGRPAVVTLLPPLAAGARGGTFHPIARLAGGVSREQAQAEIDALLRPLAADNAPGSAKVALDDVRSILYPTGRPIMMLLVVAAALVLTIGCMNLAIMLAARGRRLEYETAVRAALGASRGRLVRPMIFEALMLGLGGGALALIATTVAFDGLLRQVPPVAYGNAPVGVDLRVALFALALGVGGGLLAAAVPAWRAGAGDVQLLLQTAHGARGARGRALDAPMLAVQVALAIVLVFGAVIVARAFVGVLRVPLGFSPDNVITVGVAPPAGMPDARAFYTRAIQAIAGRADVISAGAAGSMPLNGAAPDEGAVATADPRRTAGIIYVLPGYFETVGIRLVRGRLLSRGDVASGVDVAVVAESTARVLFPDRDPLDETFDNGHGRQFTVVGVVADVLKSHERESPPPAYVIPQGAARLTIVVRARTRQDATLAGIRQQVAAVAPGVPITAGWWSDAIARLTAYRNPRFQTLVLGAFAALALGLTSLGIFAVIAFAVASRTREMGIRLAIGASPRSLVRLMTRQAVLPVAAGVVLGLAGTRWISGIARSQLFNVDMHDPVTLAAAALVVGVTALVAAYMPARHASKVDPLVALREQ